MPTGARFIGVHNRGWRNVMGEPCGQEMDDTPKRGRVSLRQMVELQQRCQVCGFVIHLSTFGIVTISMTVFS